ncbi:hypothetical protein ACRQ1B_25380 [Rhizobium panacihumi]|uniref:hypothetical protein n=1 Tax=Rhizobium panacihumi TaxID=2008450 RepID=UPI003D799B89
MAHDDTDRGGHPQTEAEISDSLIGRRRISDCIRACDPVRYLATSPSMKTLIRLVIAFCGILICCFLALLVASLAAQAGMLGSCFEGSCGYAAAFLVAPLLSIGFIILFFILWRKLRRHRRRV